MQGELHQRWGRWLPSVMLLLAACQTAPTPQEAAEQAIRPQNISEAIDLVPPPEDWKEQVKTLAGKGFVNPKSLRRAAISQPFKITVQTWQGPPRQGWMVCLKANGKDELGANAGVQVTGYFFEDGKLTDSIGPVGTHHPCWAEKYKHFRI